MLYYSLFYPYLEYCCEVWGNTNQQWFKKSRLLLHTLTKSDHQHVHCMSKAFDIVNVNSITNSYTPIYITKFIVNYNKGYKAYPTFDFLINSHAF